MMIINKNSVFYFQQIISHGRYIIRSVTYYLGRPTTIIMQYLECSISDTIIYYVVCSIAAITELPFYIHGV